MELAPAPGPYTHSDWLQVSDRVRLRYAFNDRGTRGVICIAPGWTENTYKYRELAGELVDLGYSVFVLDHRSQGESSRPAGNPQMTHIDRFEDYVCDLDAFYRRIVLPRAHREVVVLGHSLGGLIAARFASSHPPRLRALVLSSPLFEVHGGLLPEWIMYRIASALTALGRGKRYVPGHGDFDKGDWSFDDNSLTRSKERFERWRKILLDNPRLRVGGVSNSWLKSVIRATRSVVARAPDIRVPVLILQAGLDSVVRPRRQELFCRRAEECALLRFPTARHELLMETDSVRDQVLAAIVEFIERVERTPDSAAR